MSSDLTLTWAKKPTISSNSRRSAHALRKKTVENRSPKQICPKCSLLGFQSALQLLQLNDDEAILMCKNVECTFMSSSKWEDLVVKRDISRLNGVGSKKVPSQRKAKSVSSAPQSSQPYTRTTQSIYSSASNFRPHSLPSSLEGSRASTPVENKTSKFEEEKKTLVPFAPFICGHAHSFSSFETKRIEKGQLCKNFDPSLFSEQPPLISSVSFDKRLPLSSTSRSRSVVGKNRRSSSVESESVSSGSLDSRPSTPTFATQVSHSNGKKIKKLVVPQETLARIIDGSLEIKIIKSSKQKGKRVENCFPNPDTCEAVTTYESTPVEKEIDPSETLTASGLPSPSLSASCENQSFSSHIQAINNLVAREGLESLDISFFNSGSLTSVENSSCPSYHLDPLGTSHIAFDTNSVDSHSSNSADRHSDTSDSSARNTEECMDFVLGTSLFDQ